jgi:T4 RnlA family RNA ligase
MQQPMHVQTYLRTFGLEKIQSELGIKVKVYEDEGLMVLNYSQIDSPKSHPVVVECRGLILDLDFNVVSRSMDRFFNLGEVPESQACIDMQKAVCFQKVDGSLIRIYNHKGTWYIATRGMACAEATVNGFNVTFKELVLKALGLNEQEFQDKCNVFLLPDVTYICEITSTENRCVKSYSGYTLWYLTARSNVTFEYLDQSSNAKVMNMSFPRAYSFDSMEDINEDVRNLKNLDEGYVMYQDGVPICKIKSPAYCAVHLLRGEGLNPKRVCELVLTGEQEEYLTYFPEDRAFIQEYVDKFNEILQGLELAYFSTKSIQDQKEFALAIRSVQGNSVLFTARKMSISPKEAFKLMPDSAKLKMLLGA